MKTKIVLWGSNEKDEKLLLAIELVSGENKVLIHAFPSDVVTESFYNQMMNLWRNGNIVPFPEKFTTIERELSAAENLLPDTIKVERTDIVNRAKTEWHFVVLSAKLREVYDNEIESFKDKIGQLSKFDDVVWNDLKTFWDKVQAQVREKNLFREHADELRENTNNLFGKLKELRKSLNEEFSQTSKTHVEQFTTTLKGIEDRVNQGFGLHPIFNELKSLQKEFNETEFTRSDRSTVWKKLDNAFKLVKEKKFGSKSKDGGSLDRLNRRFSGLNSAIGKMQNSISRDKKDIEFQNKRIDTTEGQLELQIRQAKLSMIQERIKSKEEKLNDMLKTKTELEAKIDKEKIKEEKRKEKEEIEKAKIEAKEKIASSIKEKSEELESDPSIAKAAEKIISGKTHAKTPEIKLTENKENTDVTARVALPKEETNQPEPTETKAEESVPVNEKESESASDKEEGNDSSDDNIVKAIGNTVGEAMGNVGSAMSNVIDTVKAAAIVVSDKIEDKIEDIIDGDSNEEE